ncbi:MAG: hypothetical protein A2381_19775 [Bdellovibrionales bacterium RIFOXYB1_FULL_37_110]|nr:MAG: hypothetical protein A2181_06560 [Bdellovibrionales bacterium RIFOXYA1_FULL_38_20]OFZ45464.1 MAG: hypothetical protein A2417_18040 [Bdellovibrionales bacterium RIFOXYC1_FULL_37_79]OFZ61022.1 MAG: hypothetical protein A2381_19775 [Bdellovibrionales bacterium RIFOXYB1_FULL_37_110]OFZ63473.1 MAG: hypothetical protein A2577_06295 [Bdellovibrionales bacterium RIFOXYD1_FULL_36_51]OFZ67791.1 MAG: hypothetical protein A2328_06995 [Bdellovibrionales bacterium RIFOXYB2_FULL_36_6]
MIKFLLIFALLFVSPGLICATYYDRLQARGLGEYWLKLIHFEQNFFLPSYSRADRHDFFFYREGSFDPEKELNETINAFQTGLPLVGDKGLHPQCAFPERLKLIKNLNITDLREIECREFKSWKNDLRPLEIFLIFKQPLVNKTADFLGEVFLKIKTDKNKEYAGLFNIAKNTKNYYFPKPLQRLIGLSSLEIKITDYDTFIKNQPDYFSSTFYEYRLRLSPEEMDRIINHIWELQNSNTFNYYLISENRSFFIASLLQIGKDHWNLIKNNKFYFTPRDLIRNLASYPDDIEKKEYFSSDKDQTRFSVNNQAVIQKTWPDKSHPTQKIEFTSILAEDHPILGLGYQAGYHGLLSSDQGYQDYSSLDFFKINITYDTTVKKYKVPEINIFEYTYLYPVTKGDFGWSKKGALKKDYVQDIDLSFKSRNRLYYGMGLTFTFLGTFSLFTGLEYQRSAYTKKHDRLGPWGEWMIFFNFFRSGKILLRQKIISSFLEDVNDAYYVENEAAASITLSTNYELFLKNLVVTKTGELAFGQYQISLGLGKYF